MKVFAVVIIAGLAYLLAYHTYGKWLAQKVFRLSPDASCPSKTQYDGVDYVPTAKEVVFGHHFTSIAGTGPIVGPAIAVLWGWLPALLWVLFGAIWIGAVHDFGSLVVSLRNRGQTIGDIAGRLLNVRVRLLFFIILLLCLTVVLAVFGLVIASVFHQFPSAIFPCLIQIPIAIAVGWWIRRIGGSLFLASAIALGLMYLSVFYGNVGLLGQFNNYLASQPIVVWIVFLLVYVYVASVLPVWVLLQPRDYINALQLISALGLITLGLAVSAIFGGRSLTGQTIPLDFVAPAFQWHPKGAPAFLPFLFITIACGAISGFHSLVSSGTSSKQLQRETDAQFVGYGGMLLESFLAVLVILACTVGLGLGVVSSDGTVLVGHEAWLSRYTSWAAAGSLAAKIGAFVQGAGNFLRSLGIPTTAANALMGVLVASFAGTTMDTACRLERYVVQELAGTVSQIKPLQTPVVQPIFSFLRNRYGATLLVVVLGGALATIPPPGQSWSLANVGKGGLILWPLFGATNQLLAGLAFLVVFFYLWRRRRPIFFLVLPLLFMLILPFWTLLLQVFIGTGNQPGWIAQGKWTLAGIGIASMALEIWMIWEAVRLFPKTRGVLEEEAMEREQAQADEEQGPVVSMGC